MFISLDINIDDITDAIYSGSSCRKDLVELIKYIDARVAEVDFTSELRDYFVEQMKIEEGYDE